LWGAYFDLRARSQGKETIKVFMKKSLGVLFVPGPLRYRGRKKSCSSGDDDSASGDARWGLLVVEDGRQQRSDHKPLSLARKLEGNSF